MAAFFYSPGPNDQTIFRRGFSANTSIHVPTLYNAIGDRGHIVITEVTVQNRDTIQYFLTFDDFISYFYFGKGLGSLSISGLIFTDNRGLSKGANSLHNIISNIRGRWQNISFGNAVFAAVLSSFTVRLSAEDNLNHAIEFNLQFDIIDHSLMPPVFTPVC